VVRAFGPGPEGAGWPVELPAFPGTEGPLRLRLRDQAVAVAAAAARPIVVGGDRHAGFLDQRTGRPAEGVVATAAAAELGIDAEALAVAAFVLGSREATFLLGQLRPTPSVLWLLGTGSGRPLMTSHHWSRLATF
jgi:thiamine biosynthesis lipoprotein ApbE